MIFSSPLPPPPVENMLVLEAVEVEDQGTYVCRAVNSAGTVEERLQVIVEPSSSNQQQQRPGRDYQPQPEQYYQPEPQQYYQ